MHLSNLVVYDLLKGTRELEEDFSNSISFLYFQKQKPIQTLSQDVIINSFLLPESKGFFCSIITICLEGRNCSWLMTSLITTCRRFQLSTDAKKVQVQAPSVLFYLWMWQECSNGSSFTRKIVKFPQKLPFSIKPCFAGLETWLTMQATSPLILLHWLD